MLRKCLPAVGLLALAACGLVLTPAPGQAAPRGGFHGGWHGGGWHGGGWHGGGWHGGWHGGWSGYRGGFYGRGWAPRYYGHSYYPWGLGFGLGYYPSYLYGGYSPSFSYGVVTTPYVPGYVAPGPGVTAEADYPPSSGGASGGIPADAETAPAAATARVTVVVPDANAQVWFNGVLTRPTGTRREFVSPPLAPGRDYTYEVRARWSEGGRRFDQTKTVLVRAGEHVLVNFTNTAPQPEAPQPRPLPPETEPSEPRPLPPRTEASEPQPLPPEDGPAQP
jgi:uncharacterized protein (TIGR03000 family)